MTHSKSANFEIDLMRCTHQEAIASLVLHGTSLLHMLSNILTFPDWIYHFTMILTAVANFHNSVELLASFL